ncbi:MAG: hypothetical protein JWR61_1428 [Ferruginibacter sp.]|nr:hypothetical protein [Ferruginibacter sp.]
MITRIANQHLSSNYFFMQLFFIRLLVVIILPLCVYSQSPTFDKVQFFKQEKPVPVTLEAYWSKIMNQKNTEGKVFPARLKATLDDSSHSDEPVDLVVRGHFRRDYCMVPPIKLSFYKSESSVMHSLKSLKLVSACRLTNTYGQYLVKEFLLYKMYNLLTDKSFRVRMLQLEYKDSSEKKGSFTNYAFLIEDVKDMAKRNGCIESDKKRINTVSTDRKQMTIVALFEYMIGNTDWSVPAGHNIKLLESKDDSLAKPFCVPYDFDYSGIINADYAAPDPLLNTESVTQRVYRGFPRTMDELKDALATFKQQKDNIYALVNNCALLTSKNKGYMLDYLDSFYNIVKNERTIKTVFIDNARYD